MRVDIDFSIFTSAPSAEGVISGNIEVDALPRAGEIISFFNSPNESIFPSRADFDPLLKVENVIHSASGRGVALQLQDVTLPNRQSVAEVAAYLEQGFGLFFDPISE
ncbi:hypothetical protein [Stutzerimonas stutzeri]|uniref:hypothetical protein n=1 Tax=Stutzerimonas stutzeri TaxID=316 RepID=UPI00210EA119|nr:hypothetical protein [Stutzerimonas stutzeri]MCQ4261179.1 hypothetical protein [Stutzerimonas stutzeri]